MSDDVQSDTSSEDAVDYKKQYEAALRAGDKATRSYETTLTQLTAEKQAHEATKASVDNLKTEMATLTVSLGQKDLSLTELQKRVTEFEPVKAKAIRLELIMSEFPQLASFEKDGLLPGGETSEVLRESFKKFSERLGELSKSTGASYSAGGKPENVPAPEQKKNSTDLAKGFLDAAIQAQRSGNMAEYESNFTKYLHEKNKQQA